MANSKNHGEGAALFGSAALVSRLAGRKIPYKTEFVRRGRRGRKIGAHRPLRKKRPDLLRVFFCCAFLHARFCALRPMFLRSAFADLCFCGRVLALKICGGGRGKLPRFLFCAPRCLRGAHPSGVFAVALRDGAYFCSGANRISPRLPQTGKRFGDRNGVAGTPFARCFCKDLKRTEKAKEFFRFG